jgi:O-antigen ligase
VAQIIRRNQTLRLTTFLFVILLSLFVLRQLLSQDPLIASITLLRSSIMAALMLILLQLRHTIKSISLVYAMAATIIFQSVVGIYQWSTQSSVGGYLFLGEPNLQQPLGLAKTSWFGKELLLPYGTTAHPNVLGGMLAVYLVALLYLHLSTFRKQHKQQIAVVFATVIGVVTILLTQSMSALIGLSLGILVLILHSRSFHKVHALLFIKVRNIVAIIVLCTLLTMGAIRLATIAQPNQLSFVRRYQLNDAAIIMIAAYPMQGVGLSNFTVFLDQSLSHEKAIVPFLQPVHNIFLLSFAEVGVLGIAVFVALRQLTRISIHDEHSLGWFSSKIPLIMIVLLPLALLDHYLLTIQTGQLLLALTPLLFMKVTKF